MSVILLKHYNLGGEVTEGLGAGLWLQLKDLLIIGVMFMVFHFLIFFEISFPLWDAMAAWFVQLPIT